MTCSSTHSYCLSIIHEVLRIWRVKIIAQVLQTPVSVQALLQSAPSENIKTSVLISLSLSKKLRLSSKKDSVRSSQGKREIRNKERHACCSTCSCVIRRLADTCIPSHETLPRQPIYHYHGEPIRDYHQEWRNDLSRPRIGSEEIIYIIDAFCARRLCAWRSHSHDRDDVATD